jgi:DNA-directed RNA polymerase subunit RPC12/RpoP
MKKQKIDEIPVQKMIGYFGTESKCIKTLERIIWKDGIKCRKCNKQRIHKHPSKKYQYHCTDCNREFNVKTGTIFQGTKIDLPSWFHTIGDDYLKRGFFCVISCKIYRG